jgi:hypothetical protein
MEFTESEYCFESVASFGNCELCWDYEIINDTVTYEFGGNVISSYTSFTGCDFECLPSITSCAGNATTCPIVTQTLPCQSVEYGFSDACCGTSYNHADTDPFFGVSGRCAVLAGNPELGLEPCAFFRDPVPVPYFARDSSCEIPCESACCHFFDCGDCSTCTDKFSIGYGSQEITIETTCGPVSGGQCCISLGPRTVNVVWA